VWEAGRQRIALVAPTAADARDVIVEGESGLLAALLRAIKAVADMGKRRDRHDL
jgi:phage terminase large subunit-like protein